MSDPQAYQLPEGFAIPVRRSLTEPILLGGVPRTAAILNGTLAAALGLGLQLWLLGIIYYAVSYTHLTLPTILLV